MKIFKQLISEQIKESIFVLDVIDVKHLSNIENDLEPVYPVILCRFAYRPSVAISILEEDEKLLKDLVSKLSYVIFCIKKQ